MVNGKHITGRLSVGLPKPEIQRPISLDWLEDQLGLIPTGFGLLCVGFIPEIARSRTDIMASASE
jgi:hypothetical protein